VFSINILLARLFGVGPADETLVRVYQLTGQRVLSVYFETNVLLLFLLSDKPPILFCFLAVFDPRVGHTMDVLSPFVPVLCHFDSLTRRVLSTS